MKTIFKYVIKIKHEQDIIKEKNKIKELQQKLNQSNQDIIKRTQEAVNLFPQPYHKSGKIYIASTEDKANNYTFKIGQTTKTTRSRNQQMKTSCPEINILAEYDCKDIDFAEKIVHRYLDNLRQYDDKEFFFISSLEKCKEIVKDIVDFTDNLIKKYDNEYMTLQNEYINNDVKM